MLCLTTKYVFENFRWRQLPGCSSWLRASPKNTRNNRNVLVIFEKIWKEPFFLCTQKRLWALNSLERVHGFTLAAKHVVQLTAFELTFAIEAHPLIWRSEQRCVHSEIPSRSRRDTVHARCVALVLGAFIDFIDALCCGFKTIDGWRLRRSRRERHKEKPVRRASGNSGKTNDRNTIVNRCRHDREVDMAKDAFGGRLFGWNWPTDIYLSAPLSLPCTGYYNNLRRCNETCPSRQDKESSQRADGDYSWALIGPDAGEDMTQVGCVRSLEAFLKRNAEKRTYPFACWNEFAELDTISCRIRDRNLSIGRARELSRAIAQLRST